MAHLSNVISQLENIDTKDLINSNKVRCNSPIISESSENEVSFSIEHDIEDPLLKGHSLKNSRKITNLLNLSSLAKLTAKNLSSLFYEEK